MGRHRTFDWGTVAARVRAGMTDRAIADEIGINQQHVALIRRRFGLSANSPLRRFTDDDRATAERLFADGCSSAEVARTLGWSAAKVSREFPGHGWTPHEAGEFANALRRMNA